MLLWDVGCLANLGHVCIGLALESLGPRLKVAAPTQILDMAKDVLFDMTSCSQRATLQYPKLSTSSTKAMTFGGSGTRVQGLGLRGFRVQGSMFLVFNFRCPGF